MALKHAESGEIVDVRPLGAALAESQTVTLAKNDAFELLRLVLPAGKEIPAHQAPAEIIVQCLEGRVAFTAGDETTELAAGHMLHLKAAEPHALRGIEDASLLVTILLPGK